MYEVVRQGYGVESGMLPFVAVGCVLVEDDSAAEGVIIAG